MARALVARAPTRLDFGGGWTDVPPYCDELGGAVCNLAIARYATATVSIARGEQDQHSAGGAHDALIRAALQRAGIPNGDAQLTSDFPVGAGLGGSSAAGVALAGALAALGGEVLDRAALAARSRATEAEELGIAGGFQDHYAAAYGGALLLSFGNGVSVDSLPLSRESCAVFARRGLLFYTGESRMSGTTVAAVANAYRERVPRVCNALARMTALARQMADAVRHTDVDALGALIAEHWVHQRALHPSITTDRIDAIIHTSRTAGAIGAKALGASGGGCVLVIAAEGKEEEVARALAPLAKRLPWAVDTGGFEIVAVLDDQSESWESR